MRLNVKHIGSFNRTEKWLAKNKRDDHFIRILKNYGQRGVSELQRATPMDTGEAAASWYYTVEQSARGYRLSWNNSKMAGNVPLVVLLQYGHGTTGGTWVPGRDFINPALVGIVDSISRDLWKEVENG